MPCLIVDGNAGWKAVYDERGNRTSWTFFGIDGKPCLIKAGYAGWRSTFDARGNETSKTCFDADGKPCLNSYRFAGWKATYDDRGNMLSRVFFDAGGKPCLSIDGFAGWKATFDERGNQTSFSYFGMKGEPIIAPKLGYHRIVTSYDPNGKVLEEKYFDCQGKPLTLAETLKAAANSMPAEGSGPPRRVTVTDVLPGGEAAAKGIREGDIIVRYAGHPITSIRAFILEANRGGMEPRTIVLLRDGKEITRRVAFGPLKFRLEETPIEPSRESKPAASEKTTEKASTPAAKTVPPRK